MDTKVGKNPNQNSTNIAVNQKQDWQQAFVVKDHNSQCCSWESRYPTTNH